MQSPRLPKLSEETLTRRAARAGRIRSSPARAANSRCPARSRSICTRRPSASSRKSSAAICASRPACRRGSRNSPSCAPDTHWKAQYEWAMHAPMAEKQGVKPQTIRDIQAGRAPKSAPRDEMAIYAFVKELYGKRRVSTADLQSRAKAAWRRRHGRAGRHPRLLRHGVDDAQHLPCAAARRHAGAVQRAGASSRERSDQATRPTGLGPS